MNDAISRSELLKQFPVNMENPLWHFTGIRAAIEATPAIDVAPVVHARWIMNHFGAKCSNCLRLYCVEPSWSEKIKHMPPTWIYCPNCGAKMDGEADA